MDTYAKRLRIVRKLEPCLDFTECMYGSAVLRFTGGFAHKGTKYSLHEFFQNRVDRNLVLLALTENFLEGMQW